MNITRKDTDALNAILSISLKKEDYLPKTEQALKKLGKTVSMKGFRTGMVPAGLVKKMYGTSVLVDELNKVVSDAVNSYIDENKLEILGRPLPVANDNKMDIQNPTDYSLDFELGLAPQFDIDFLKSSTVVKSPKVVIDDELLDKEVDNLRGRYGKMTFPESGIEEKDILQVKFVEFEEGKAKEDGITSSGPINLEIVKDAALKKKLLKAKIGDTFHTKDIFAALDREREQVVKFVLGQKEAPENLGSEYEMTIEKISRMEKAELNQEFFDKAFGPDQVKSEEEAKNKLKSELSNYMSVSENGKLNEKIYNLLLEKTEIPLPDEFLKKWIKVSNEKPITDDVLEEEYPIFAKNLKWSLIVNKISKENDLKGDFEEVKDYSKEALRQQLQQYAPGGGFSEDDLENLNNNMLAKEDHVKKSYDAVMEQKLFQAIKQQITVEEEEVKFDDFFKS